MFILIRILVGLNSAIHLAFTCAVLQTPIKDKLEYNTSR